ncbi:hypothetical protein KFE25_000686 [Diacronema lutheri]|uniref:Uncharacterized protein n=1 Tax=Diacronema lutheri TaxID=2081491 RepID=A0A8J5XT09_DIALT|nr:hypothetical protein KFE25_000686 [Diacronema lutheri]
MLQVALALSCLAGCCCAPGRAALSSRTIPICARAGIIGRAGRPSAFTTYASVSSASLTAIARTRAVFMRVHADEIPQPDVDEAIIQPDDDEAIVERGSSLMASGRSKTCSARSTAGRTRCVMATLPPRPSLPPAWSFIASKLPDDIRAVLEDMVKQMEDKVMQMEDKVKLINEFNEGMVKQMEDKVRLINESNVGMVKQMEDKVKLINESNDKLIAAKDEVIIAKNERIVKMEHDAQEINEFKDKWIVKMEHEVREAEARRLKDLGHYQVVYELRDTFDWLLRCAYPGTITGGCYTPQPMPALDAKNAVLKELEETRMVEDEAGRSADGPQ